MSLLIWSFVCFFIALLLIHLMIFAIVVSLLFHVVLGAWCLVTGDLLSCVPVRRTQPTLR